MTSHWNKAKLGDIADVITKGTTPRTLGRDYCASGVGFVRAENLQGGWVDLNSIDLFIDEETDSLLARSRIVPGDVLITIAGTIGRTGVVPSGAGPLNSNQAVALVRLTQQMNPQFLEYWLRTGEGQHQIAGGKVTQNIPNLSLGQIGGLVVPVPDPREQARIVELLDQADALRRQRAEADTKLARLLPALFRHHFGDPRDWIAKIKLDQLVQKEEQTDPSLYPDEEFRYIDIAAVDGESGVITAPKILFGSEAPSRARKRIRLRDVIISTVRPNLRATALVSDESLSGIASTGFAVLRSQKPCGHGFLYAVTRMPWFTESLVQRVKGANYPAVNVSDVRNVEIPKVDWSQLADFDSAVEKSLTIQAQAAASAAKIETLFQTLLHRAFTGELTAKWREANLREGVQEMTRLNRA